MLRPAPPRKTSRTDDALARADVALRMGQVHEAEQIAMSVLKADKSNLLAAMIGANALLAQKRSADAIAILERITKRHTDPGATTLLASALAADGRRDEALQQLAFVTGKDVAYAPAFRAHAGHLAASGCVAEAITIAERGVAKCPEAIELRLDLAALHLRQNERAAARDVLTAARDMAPGRADILSELARVLILEGDYAAAADTCRHALALQPDNALTRANLAACQLELGQREAGEATLRAAVNGRPQMVSRAIHALAASSHGRFFMRPSDVARFLAGKKS